MDKMFCCQCAETLQNKGCSVKGICGKTAEIANLQDKLIYVTKKIECGESCECRQRNYAESFLHDNQCKF